MKKIILTITFLFVTFIVFAQEFVITLKKDLILTDDYGVEYNYKKGNKFIYNVNKNGFGVSMLYLLAHLKKDGIKVKEGQMVKPGQIVALAGNSGSGGNTTHLHLEVFYNGQYINPFLLYQ